FRRGRRLADTGAETEVGSYQVHLYQFQKPPSNCGGHCDEADQEPKCYSGIVAKRPRDCNNEKAKQGAEQCGAPKSSNRSKNSSRRARYWRLTPQGREENIKQRLQCRRRLKQR